MKVIRICSVFVLNEDNNVLSVKQHYESLQRHVWTLPGGGIEDGETPEQAVHREVMEETGYELDGELHNVYRCLVTTPDVHLDVYGFLCRGHKGDVCISEEEISDIGFLPLDVALQEMSVIDDEARVAPISHVLKALQNADDIMPHQYRYSVDAQRRIVRADPWDGILPA